MLRLLEHYPSIQGEGPRTGIPTQFVRFAGCNLRCAKWPCDTPYAIEPKLYRQEQVSVSVHNLYSDIMTMRLDTGADNVCLTGGEPMLQKAEDIGELLEVITMHPGMTAEMFSNGTLPYTDAVLDLCSIVMDWKLPGSGEESLNPTRETNYYAMKESGGHTIKFTCADQEDLEYAAHLYGAYGMRDFGTVYAGPVWDSKLPPRQIVDFILSCGLPWRLNVQLHKYVWDPAARRT